MKLFEKVRAKKELPGLFRGTVEKGDDGYIVEIYHNPDGFCIEFGVDRNESILAECKEEDLELVTE